MNSKLAMQQMVGRADRLPTTPGYKITDRYGDTGVVCLIDEEPPTRYYTLQIPGMYGTNGGRNISIPLKG